MSALQIADLIGVFVFALSGGMMASRIGLDFFGVLVVSLLPAIGGGTLRDLLLDRPVFWLEDWWVIVIALAAGAMTWVIGERIARFKTLIWLDAMGLALFAVTGARIAHELGYGPVIVIMMGTMTASFGGLIRDIVCNEVPLILREDIYATAALLGAAVYWLLVEFLVGPQIAMAAGGGIAFAVRALVLAMRNIKPRKQRE